MLSMGALLCMLYSIACMPSLWRGDPRAPPWGTLAQGRWKAGWACLARPAKGRLHMKKILLMNGPNLNMLGVREPEVYGRETLASIEAEVVEYGAQKGVQVDCFQSNHEGALIDKLHEAHEAYDGVVYNPGAHTHDSYALRDAVGSIDTPVVEVHLSDIDAREAFRAVSVIEPACIAQIKGKGKQGYKEGIDALLAWERERGSAAGEGAR